MVSSTPFTWDLYLKLIPAEVAPRGAFNQPLVYPENKFKIGMKLEARDPRNTSCWCLASVINIEGLRFRLRFDGSDNMNDLYELIDSENVRAFGSMPGEQLLPPMAFKGNLATYPKFVDKVLSSPGTVIAPPDFFPRRPVPPKQNLFKKGMKLEACDTKQRGLVCVASIAEVNGDKVRVLFDGWRGSFDYECHYTSRDLFPVSWCQETGYTLQPPNGWEGILARGGKPAETPVKGHSQRNTTPENVSSKEHKTGNKQPAKSPSSPSRKGRGRPKVEKPNKSNVSGSQASSSKVSFSGAKKANDAKNFNKEESDPDDNMQQDEEETSEVLDEGDNNLPKDRYQCARTVSYSEWKRKKIQSQMPHNDDLANDDSNNGTNDHANLGEQDSFDTTLSSMRDGESTDNASSKQSKKIRLEGLPETFSSNEGREVLKSKPSSTSLWTVQDVIDLISIDETLVKYSNVFTENEIDGKAFMLLTTDVMKNHMGLKIGPVLKINDLIEQVRLSR